MTSLGINESCRNQRIWGPRWARRWVLRSVGVPVGVLRHVPGARTLTGHGRHKFGREFSSWPPPASRSKKTHCNQPSIRHIPKVVVVHRRKAVADQNRVSSPPTPSEGGSEEQRPVAARKLMHFCSTFVVEVLRYRSKWCRAAALARYVRR